MSNGLNPAAAQGRLSREQIEAFYHDEFAEDQARHFLQLIDVQAGDRCHC